MGQQIFRVCIVFPQSVRSRKRSQCVNLCMYLPGIWILSLRDLVLLDHDSSIHVCIF